MIADAVLHSPGPTCLPYPWRRGPLPRSQVSAQDSLAVFFATGDIRTLRITTFRISPLSLRPSGLAESPLFRIGLALRLFVLELAAELLE